MPGWQSLTLSDQILSDILRAESVMFNSKFTYLKIFGVTWEF